MTRSYTLSGVYDAFSRPISQAIAKAFNATDRNGLALVETQQLLLGECTFSALPDTVPIDINVFWSSESRWYYDIFAVTGTSLEEAVSKMHTQGTDVTLGTLTANINMGGKKVTSLGTPTADADAVTKSYVDLASMGGLPIEVFKWIWIPAGEGLYADLSAGEMQCRVSGADAGSATLIHQGFKLDDGKMYVWELA